MLPTQGTTAGISKQRHTCTPGARWGGLAGVFEALELSRCRHDCTAL
jgi:hypothetical protein